MKTIKSILVLVLLTSFSQMNAQKILEKWEDLNNVNQIYTKVAYVANEGSFDILPKYTTILKKYTEKLNEKAVPGDLATPTVTGLINNLKEQAASLDTAAEKKATKDEIYNKMKSFSDTLNSLIASCKIE